VTVVLTFLVDMWTCGPLDGPCLDPQNTGVRSTACSLPYKRNATKSFTRCCPGLIAPIMGL
jgi:hypothetical protein